MRAIVATVSGFALLTASSLWGPVPAYAQDRSFAEQALTAGMSEIKEGSLAMKQSHQPAIQEFGRWMVTDHTAIDHFLRERAAADGVTVPTSLTSKQQSEYDQLQKLTGADFDKQYIDQQVSAHEKAVSLFGQEAESGTYSGMNKSGAAGPADAQGTSG
jgi:putative membrane protein